MGGREFGYYGPSDADVGVGCVSVLVIVLGIPLALALLVLSFQGEPVDSASPRPSSEFADPVSDVPINAGDIYLDESAHTAMCVQNDSSADLLAEFSISETGDIDGEPGDQTGNESSVHGYYEAWDGIGTMKGVRTTPPLAAARPAAVPTSCRSRATARRSCRAAGRCGSTGWRGSATPAVRPTRTPASPAARLSTSR